MPKARPLVAAACLCEKVIRESDNVLTAIRIVDVFKVDLPDDAPEDAVFTVGFHLLVILRTGEARGKGTLKLDLLGPTGQRKTIVERNDVLMEKGAGSNVVVNMTLPFKRSEMGRYVFDVMWNGDLLTKSPFNIEPVKPSPS